MVRNLKTLGLVLAAVFAFSAMAATGAVAQETQGHITSDGGQNFTLTGTEDPAGVNAFTGAFGTEIKCPGSTYAGHKVGVTPHQFLTSGETNTTISPTYHNCKDQNNKNITVNMNGCDYDLTDATTTGGEGTWGVKVSVTCPGSNRIEVTGGTCKVTVGSQGHLSGLHLTNEEEEVEGKIIRHIRLSGSVTLAATVCGFPGSATQHQDVTVTAHNEAGQTIGVRMSD